MTPSGSRASADPANPARGAASSERNVVPGSGPRARSRQGSRSVRAPATCSTAGGQGLDRWPARAPRTVARIGAALPRRRCPPRAFGLRRRVRPRGPGPQPPSPRRTTTTASGRMARGRVPQACSRRPWVVRAPVCRPPASRSGSATPYAVSPSVAARLSHIATPPRARSPETNVDLPTPPGPASTHDGPLDLEDRHVQRRQALDRRPPECGVVHQHLRLQRPAAHGQCGGRGPFRGRGPPARPDGQRLPAPGGSRWSSAVSGPTRRHCPERHPLRRRP